MGNCRSCQIKNRIRALTRNNNPLIQICFLTVLETGNTFDPTRQGFLVTNAKDLTLGPIQTKCKVTKPCGCECEEQQCATLEGNLFWTVSIPIFSLCAAPGSNTGFQSVSGIKMIIERSHD